MPSKHDPAECLADIVENAARIESYLTGINLEEFAASGLLRDAVERCLERVCEAAYRLGDRAVDLMPNQPWGDIRGMGNRIRHAYDRISLDVIWNAARYDLPGLAAEAQRVHANLVASPGGHSHDTG